MCLKKAILRGLTTESIQIKELSELIDNRIINFDSWSIAQLALIGRQLNSKNGQNKFSAIELAELLRRDLVLTPKDIGLIDNIYSFDEQIELLVKPVESPLEVLRNTAPLAPTPPQVFDQDEEELVDAVFQLAYQM